MTFFKKKDEKSYNNYLEAILIELVNGLSKLIQFSVDKLVFHASKFISDSIEANRTNSKKLNLHLTNKKNQTTKEDAIGFSINEKRSFLFKELDTTKHTAIIGSTGSGKTVCMENLMENALKRGQPIIYFDPKNSRDNLERFKLKCKLYGKDYFIFNDSDSESSSFNPLADCSKEDLVNNIMNAIIWSEPFYKNECEDALSDVVRDLYKFNERFTFQNIYNRLLKHPNHNNIKTLLNHLKMVNNSKFGDLLNQEVPNHFKKLRGSECCLYIGISSMGMGSLGNFLNKIFFGGLLIHAKYTLLNLYRYYNDIEEKNAKDMPISIFFDELSSTIHEGFIDLQNKCREAAMEITYATQGPADFEKISPSLSNQIFENTNNIFLFNQIVPTHTEYFSKMFGTIKSSKNTYVTENDITQATGTTRETEEFIVHGNIIRNLKVGQCVFYQRAPKKVHLLNIKFNVKKTNKEQRMIEMSKLGNNPLDKKIEIIPSEQIF